MWSRWVDILLKGDTYVIGPSWMFGPLNRSVVLHKIATMPVPNSGASSSSSDGNNQWFKTIDETTLSSYPGRHMFYNAGRRLMVSRRLIILIT
jgi:hypothetical protein